jgi:nitroreductase
MPRNQAVLDFLLNRASVPAKLLTAPVPGRAELAVLLAAATRVPDHGKLEPWRLIVLSGTAPGRIGQAIETAGDRLGMIPEKIAKAAETYRMAGLVVIVVAAPKPSDKVPDSEQLLSAGAVCLSLVNAATAAGWGANWLSGVYMHDRDFVGAHLGLADHETVAGAIHIGTAKGQISDRPRPDLTALTTWVDA